MSFLNSGLVALLALPALLCGGCDSVFGASAAEVVVAIDGGARAIPAPVGPLSAEEVHESAERVRALLVLGDARAADQHCRRTLDRLGGQPRDRAVLLYRCAKGARSLGDESRARLLFERSIALEPRVGELLTRATRGPAHVLPRTTLAALRTKVRSMGVADAQLFEVVDGPLAIGAYRAFTLEHCVEPSDVCEGAILVLGPDGTPIDGLRVPFGAFPGSLAVMSLSDPRARVLLWKADLRSELRIELFLALRLDAGRITPVAVVSASPQDPARAEEVQVRQDALVIDENEMPWDVRLRGFRGAPLTANPTPL